MHKILIAFGTRPELIKLAPIIREFRKRNQRENLFVVNTNQHKDYFQQDLDYFEIDVDYQFDLTRKNDGLSLLNGLLLLEFNQLKGVLLDRKINLIATIGQGDTCTTLAAAQFSFYEKTPFLHVEAGLRTNDFGQPFPEEFYRKTISTIASTHFALTITAQQNLLQEGIDPDSILVTGNTVIDNLKQIYGIQEFKKSADKIVLITIHRRENIKDHLKAIIGHLDRYILNNPSKTFVWIDNPGYKIAHEIIHRALNLMIIQPVSYTEMIEYYQRTELIITDSGGIVEEAAYLGIPTLQFRAKTERIEGIVSGISKFVEDSDQDINSLLENFADSSYSKFNPIYGSGYASQLIVDFIVENYLQ